MLEITLYFFKYHQNLGKLCQKLFYILMVEI